MSCALPLDAKKYVFLDGEHEFDRLFLLKDTFFSVYVMDQRYCVGIVQLVCNGGVRGHQEPIGM